jgi:CHAT domain-containing protein
LHEAIENVKSEKDTIYLNWIRKDRACYDSILYSGSRDNKLIDSVYDQYDLDRNWILQAYIVNNTTDSSKFQNLRKEYSYTNIQKNLKDSECFIDIIRFLKGDKNLGFNPKPYYAFVIVNNNQEEKLEYFFLEDGESLEELVKEDKDNTGKLTALLSPLLLKLKKYKKIYICPDGAFNLLNFYSLKDENGDFLINSKSIQYIDDPAKMFPSDSLLNRNKTISFFGNPLFKNYSPANIDSERNSVFKGSIFSSSDALPYTMLEIYASAAVLSKNGWEVKKYTGTECSEINLKKDNSPGIPHIATHGYYIPENDTTDIPYAIQKNPYLRSGLVLGDVGNNKKSLNDNILTAFEVMDLDLKNTSLVVLSACKSAEGELKPGQGVYGLQRAFKIAGARNVLVSVKNVDDKATQLLMGYFYSNVAIGENYTNALKNAQLQMIKNPLFNNSKYWDGFILIGQ